MAGLEAIAYENGWITADKLQETASLMAKNDYGRYLQQLISKSK